MENDLYLLGFSGSMLSLIFNTLKDLGYTGKLTIVENIHLEDSVPFECGLAYERIWHEQYRAKSTDALFFAVARPPIKSQVLEFFGVHHQASRDQFVNILHPSVRIAEQHQFEKGIYVDPGCILSPYAQISFGVSVLRGSSIGHHVAVGEFTTINPGVHIAGHCRIGAHVSIGVGSVLFDHVSVGAGSIIGGGSVVNKDIPDKVVAFGNPCRVIRPVTA